MLENRSRLGFYLGSLASGSVIAAGLVYLTGETLIHALGSFLSYMHVI